MDTGALAVRCSRCQHENGAAAKFCEECGTALARSCPRCGHAVGAAVKFCAACGHELAATIAPESGRDPRSYTPKHLAEKILGSRSALEGERKQVTVLFADWGALVAWLEEPPSPGTVNQGAAFGPDLPPARRGRPRRPAEDRHRL